MFRHALAVVGVLGAGLPAIAQNQLWIEQFGTSGDEWIWAAAPDDAGGVYVGGETLSPAAAGQVVIDFEGSGQTVGLIGTSADPEVWRSTADAPGVGWNTELDFDDSQWGAPVELSGWGGLTSEFAAAVWDESPEHCSPATRFTWLRAQFTLDSMPTTATMYVHADDDCEVYLNGRLVVNDHNCNASRPSGIVDVTGELVVGRNLIAIEADDCLGICHGIIAWIEVEFPGPTSYCTAGVSSTGCQARLSAIGTPSATAPSGFVLTASTVEGNKNGMFYYGTNGQQANPWGNGTSYQCVIPPVSRAGLLTGTGTGGQCDGSFSQDLNALWCSTCPKPNHNPGAGSTVQAQLWYRDPNNTSNQTTSLSDAIEFFVGP